MHLLLKRYFLSKKGALKTLAVGYSVSIAGFLIGMILRDEQRKLGYVISRGVKVYGNDASLTVIAVIGLSSALFLYTLYATVVALFFLRKGDFARLPKDPPAVVICEKCRNVFPGKETNGEMCPTCGGALEDVKGFYERHPELK
ncbi:MAG: hypothetical protein A4E57_02104 [Syntrophorhabdaceae bacterium PtaU1.Bin034]|jgi:hypothetical protein|nr:MAG: hypothetical protein A4E57_02104 [Syntrophorhabdaceae bacterium PtaU1.Bin034]